MVCVTCAEASAVCKGRCRACYEYERRTGMSRVDYLARRGIRQTQELDRLFQRLADHSRVTTPLKLVPP